MYIIVRGDIEPGRQLSQVVHASDQFKYDHPKEHKDWFESSNYIAILSVKSEDELKSLVEKICLNGLCHSLFFEPDLNDELTAVALAPSTIAKKLVSSLPLALKQRKEVCCE